MPSLVHRCATAALGRAAWHNWLIGGLVGGAGSLVLAGIFLLGRPRRETLFLDNAREWLAARLWPVFLGLSILLFSAAVVAEVIR